MTPQENTRDKKIHAALVIFGLLLGVCVAASTPLVWTEVYPRNVDSFSRLAPFWTYIFTEAKSASFAVCSLVCFLACGFFWYRASGWKKFFYYLMFLYFALMVGYTSISYDRWLSVYVKEDFDILYWNFIYGGILLILLVQCLSRILRPAPPAMPENGASACMAPSAPQAGKPRKLAWLPLAAVTLLFLVSYSWLYWADWTNLNRIPADLPKSLKAFFHLYSDPEIGFVCWLTLFSFIVFGILWHGATGKKRRTYYALFAIFAVLCGSGIFIFAILLFILNSLHLSFILYALWLTLLLIVIMNEFLNRLRH